MERLYYVECEHETVETSDRVEAARIANEWTRRGYKVDTIAVDIGDEFVELADSSQAPRTPSRLSKAISAWRLSQPSRSLTAEHR